MSVLFIIEIEKPKKDGLKTYMNVFRAYQHKILKVKLTFAQTEWKVADVKLNTL